MASADSGLPLLGYYDPLQLLDTKPYDYSTISRQAGASAVRPEFIAEMTFHRGAISSWLQSLSASVSAAGGSSGGGNAPAPVPVSVLDLVIDGLAALSGRLHGLMDLVGGVGADGEAVGPETNGAGSPSAGRPGSAAMAAAATAGWLKAEWTSALSSKPQRFLRVDSLPHELAMVYATYAAALRHQAHQRLVEAAAGDSGDGGSSGGGASEGLQAAATAAVAGLRRAAGLYAYLAESLLAELASGGMTAGGGGDRPLELLPPAARALQYLCLAEAQALVAQKAAAKGMSPGTQRALHAGCAALFRQAQDAASELSAAAPPGLLLSDRLPRLLAVWGSLHTARCHLCLALDRQKAMEMGQAEASCEECRRLLEGAARRLDRSDPPAWAESIKAQQSACSALFSAVNKDRLAVTYQALPKQPPEATHAPAVQVTVDPFLPAPVSPPRPPAGEPGKPGCTIM